MKLFLKLSLVLLTMVSYGQKKPNIVFILIDDLGSGWLPPYAQKLKTTDLEQRINDDYSKRYADFDAQKHIETARNSMPFLDKISSNAAVFENCFTTSSLCSPSRSAIVTGKYQTKWGGYTIPDVKKTGIPKNETVLIKNFQTQGYQTALIGKWHVSKQDESLTGVDKHHKKSSSEKGYGPLEMGFDYYYGFNDSHSTYNGSKNLWEGRKPVPALTEEDFLTDVFNEKATNFVEKSLKDNSPFFLYYSPMTLHGAITAPPKKYTSQFDSGAKFTNMYAGHLLALDEGIKKIYETLAKYKEEKNTIFILCSDNGSPYAVPPYNAPFRGGKGTGWLGGSHSPLIIAWPDKITSKRIDANVSTMDILPTALDLVDIKVPTNLDGVSLKETLLGGTQNLEKRVLFSSGLNSSRWSYSYYSNELKKYKKDSRDCPFYVWGIQGNNIVLSITDVVSGLYEDLPNGLPAENLYFDLEKDPQEFNPIKEITNDRKELLKKTKEWLKANKPPITVNKKKYRALLNQLD